jgi:hypothetical protein
MLRPKLRLRKAMTSWRSLLIEVGFASADNISAQPVRRALISINIRLHRVAVLSAARLKRVARPLAQL